MPQDTASEGDETPRVLILGAYGLIGTEIARACIARGWRVRGLGRDSAKMQARIDWVQTDLRHLSNAADWAALLEHTDVVANAAGALQDGPSGTVAEVHETAIAAMAQAAAVGQVQRIVQISAVGARADASTAFLVSKAQGDNAIRKSGIDYVILRPGLVLGRSVYGGTALLRMLAAVPLIQPLAHGDAEVQVVDMDDLVAAVLIAADGRVPAGTECDLVSAEPVKVRSLLAGVRAWLGFPAARADLEIPQSLSWLIGRLADGLGHLGWRSPLRTTALQALREGVTGDPAPWRALRNENLPGLTSILARHNSTLQDRWHARLSLLFPLILAVLALFWVSSGIIGLIWMADAAAVLSIHGQAPAWAYGAVIVGAVIDLALGLSVLWKRWARAACLGMLAVSFGYLLFGTILVPELWADPLGPYVKIFPSMLLALVLLVVLQDR